MTGGYLWPCWWPGCGTASIEERSLAAFLEGLARALGKMTYWRQSHLRSRSWSPLFPGGPLGGGPAGKRVSVLQQGLGPFQVGGEWLGRDAEVARQNHCAELVGQRWLLN